MGLERFAPVHEVFEFSILHNRLVILYICMLGNLMWLNPSLIIHQQSCNVCASSGGSCETVFLRRLVLIIAARI